MHISWLSIVFASILLQSTFPVFNVFGYDQDVSENKYITQQLLIENNVLISTMNIYDMLASHFIVSKTTSVGNYPVGIAANPNTGTVYVSNHHSDSVSVINGTTNSVVDIIRTNSGPVGVAVNPYTNMVYVTNYYSGTISVINGLTNNVVHTIMVGGNPWGIAINPDTNRIYVTNYFSGKVSVIDGYTNNVVNTIVVSKPWGIAVNPSTNLVYVANRNSYTVSVIDGSTNTLLTTVNVGGIPVGVAVNPYTNIVYVSNLYSYTVSVIDGSTNTLLTTVNVGNSPVGVAVNPYTNIVYVSNRDSYDVSVIDGNTNNVVDTVKVGNFPLALAINPYKNAVYVANEYSNSVSVIDIEPKTMPFTLTSLFNGTRYVVNGNTENVKITSFKINPNSSIEFELSGEGKVELVLPNNMIKGIHTIRSANQDIAFEEISTTSSSTIIRLTVPSNTHSLEIIGTTVVPEFSTIVNMVLMISILILIGLTIFERNNRLTLFTTWNGYQRP